MFLGSVPGGCDQSLGSSIRFPSCSPKFSVCGGIFRPWFELSPLFLFLLSDFCRPAPLFLATCFLTGLGPVGLFGCFGRFSGSS